MGYLGERIQSWFNGPLPGIGVPWILVPGFRRHWSVKVHLNEIGSEDASRPLDVIWNSDQILKRRFIVPAIRGNELKTVLQTEVDLAFPGQTHNLLWSLAKKERSKQGLICDLLLIRKRDVSRLQADRNVRTVWVNCADGQPILVFDNRKESDRSVRRWGALSVAFLIFSLAAALYQDQLLITEREYQAAVLQTQETTLLEELAIVRSALNEIELRADAISNGFSVLERDAAQLIYLGDLTGTLNDSSWVSEYRYKDGVIELSGFTESSAAAFLDIVQGLSWVDGTELTRPFVQDPISKKNRFSIEILVDADAI